MISELDIWRAAHLLIRQHEGDAELEAAKRADLMLERCDRDGQLVWMRIRRAVAELQGAPNRSAELTAWSAAPLLIGSVMLRLARIFRRLRDIPLRAVLRVLDMIAGPAPETPVDRSIREEGERLRKALPTIDFDDPRPRTIPPSERG